MQQQSVIIELDPIVKEADQSLETPWHVIFVFLISLLSSCLQLHCEVSPFVTHPKNMWTFLLALIIYCLALAANIKSKVFPTNYIKHSTQVVLITGSLASVSAISILVPHWLELYILMVWIPLPIYIARSVILQTGEWIYDRFKNVIPISYYNIWRRFMGSNTTMYESNNEIVPRFRKCSSTNLVKNGRQKQLRVAATI
ncbi:putative Transmembrane protein [Quillaja saponaria]|uniref:Transmembrane protein n=1 Tax=Quillaja saponaria TaxID=32244 RepID=A0AAD7LS27_QUISA|nr:putative Transmembrane protein [Quillaja saponaria]